ncbi:MAG TPA: hypothetical protein VL361_25410 [Candidatus Limnocylindrales bacterium]|jgi:hypothetical protein|nr:hypothetical protein [Candidatus Limnocylindrales bacterium]
MTLSKRMALGGGMAIVAVLATLVAVKRERRGIVITQHGQIVTVKELNAGVTQRLWRIHRFYLHQIGDGTPAAGLSL